MTQNNGIHHLAKRPSAPRPRPVIRRAVAAAAALIAFNGIGGPPAAFAAPAAKPVSLEDARYEPTAQRELAPGKRVTLTCEGRVRPSDVGAYRENGEALSSQVTTRTAHYWRDTHEGGRVKYTKVTRQFRNDTERAVIVAIWCE